MSKDQDQQKVLYINPLPSSRSGALYNAFPYPTKISPETIALFIACHTKIGATILDTFAGSGTTGLATLLCDVPTEKMKETAKTFGLSPKWGPRQAVLYEIGGLGSFVSKILCTPIDPDIFKKAALEIIDKVERKIDIYSVVDPKGAKGLIRHIIWSDITVCPRCNTEHLFWEVAVQKKPTTQILKQFKCPQCHNVILVEELGRATEVKTDPINKKKKVVKKRVPVHIYGSTNGKNWSREVTKEDINILLEIDKIPLPDSVPANKVIWGDLYRRGYHLGIEHIYDFYTRRNLIAMSYLWDAINKYPKSIRNALRFLVLSYNASHATLMSRVVIKNGNKDFVLTGAQSGVLYISSLPVEKNIFAGLRRKTKTIFDAFSMVKNSRSTITVVNKSSTRLNLEDNSIDYVFTDPPFGDYIPYSEINQINESWLGTLTNSKEEIIISPSQKKNVEDYRTLMKQVFSQIHRVLKSNGKATVVFHSAKAEVWRALTSAISDANLNVECSSILDKLQSSFKQTNSEISVKGDPLILLNKIKSVKKTNNISPEQIIDELVYKSTMKSAHLSERNAERLYSRYVSRCMELNIPITINADSFYEYVRTKVGVL